MTEVLITSSVLILVLTALRFLLRGRVSPRLQYGLWLLVALRLFIPVSLPASDISVLNAVPPSVQALRPEARPVAPPVPEAVLPAIPNDRPAAPQPPAAQSLAPTARLPLLWLTGAAGLGLWFLGSNLAFRRALRRSARRVEVDHFPLPVYVTGAVPSPCLFGLFRPAVYLTPDCLEDRSRLWHILTHEGTHYRQGDHLWSVLRCLLLCLYWFDPLVWLAGALSRRDCELSCDAGALQALGEGERTAYGRTLLSMVAPRAYPGDLFRAATTMTSGKRSLKERVKLIAKRPKMLAATLAAVVVVAAVVAVCTFTGARDHRTLEERLMSPPEALPVTMVKHPEGEEMFFSYYYNPDYSSADSYDGFLCSVLRIAPAGFEQIYSSWDMSGGFVPVGRDASGYYVLQTPTDVNFDPAHVEGYQAASGALQDWITEVFAAQKGITPIAEDPVYQSFLADCFFPGSHINAAYHPYRGTAETIDPVRPLLLSQPVKQGDGGIWCVDRWYDENGNSYLAVPETGVTMAEYYADLQAQADSGARPDLLDPAAVSLAFVQAYFQHSHATAESFELGALYQGAPTAAPSSALRAEEGLQADRQAVAGWVDTLAGRGTVVLSLTTAAGTRDVTVDATGGSAPTFLAGCTDGYTWTAVSAMPNTEPVGGYLTLYDPGRETCFRFDASHNYAFYRENGIDHWFQVASTGPAGDTNGDIYAYLRQWFDEAEQATAGPGQATTLAVGRMLEELTQSGQVGFSLEVVHGPTGAYDGGATYDKQVTELGQGNGANYLSALTNDFTWSPSAPPPEPGVVLPPRSQRPGKLPYGSARIWGTALPFISAVPMSCIETGRVRPGTRPSPTPRMCCTPKFPPRSGPGMTRWSMADGE